MPCLSNCSLKLPLDVAKHRRALLSARKMLLGLLRWMFWLCGNGKKPSIQLWSSWPGNAIFTPLHGARWHLGNPIRCCRYAICTAALKTRPLLFRRLQRPLLGTAISRSSDCFLLFQYLNRFTNVAATASVELDQQLRETLLPRSDDGTTGQGRSMCSR